MDTNAISIKNLGFNYIKEENGKEIEIDVLHDVNFQVAQGEFVCILGGNGSGKSTLAKIIDGILEPSTGDVIVYGKNSKDRSLIWDIHKDVGMVFQNPDNQIVANIVEEDVAFGLENLGLDSEEIKERVACNLDSVNMKKFRKHSPNELSGGQKQRITVAGVLAMKPKCIIFDEPTSMLEPHGREDVLSVIHQLHGKVTIILITHHMEETLQADRIFVLNQGKVVFCGKPYDIFSNGEELKRYNLDFPEIVKLENELSDNGIVLNKTAFTREELVNEIMMYIEGVRSK